MLMLTDPGFADLSDLDAYCGRFIAAASTPAVRGITGASGFPKALCTWAAQAGGEFLHDGGFGTWTIWNAAANSDTTFPRHDWLVQEDLFVDLTAHQFDGYATHLVGRGLNPLASRFSVHLASYPAVIPSGDPVRRLWKDSIEAIVRAESPASER